MTVSDDEFATIASLDLDPIKVKLMHQESGEGWSLARATAVEFEYRRYLYLMKKFPHEQAAPSVDVDTFWHYHILDTLKYAEDCQAVFGYFLHHFPYVGLRGADDLIAHQRVGERMRALYEDTFGEAYPFGSANDQGSEAKANPVARTAFSMTPSGAAFSMTPSSTAFSMTPSGNAFSRSPSVTSFSKTRSATAFSMTPSATAFSMTPSGSAFSMTPSGGGMSWERPRLLEQAIN